MKVDFSQSKLVNLATTYDATTHMFGLGMNTTAAGEKPVGAYALAFGVPTVDGAKPEEIMAFANTNSINDYWAKGTAGLVFQHSHPYIGGGTGGNTVGAGMSKQITPGTTFVFPMAVAPSITPSGHLDASNDIQLNGHANIEVVYL